MQVKTFPPPGYTLGGQPAISPAEVAEFCRLVAETKPFLDRERAIRVAQPAMPTDTIPRI